MGTSGQSQLEVILKYRDNLSPKAGRTVASLTTIKKGALETVKAVDKLTKSLNALRGLKGGSNPLGTRMPKELPSGVGLTKQLAAERQLGLRIETQQTKLLREQTKLRQDNTRLAREEGRAVEVGERARRASMNADIAGIRLKREQLKLDRETDAHTQRNRRHSGALSRVERFGGRADDVRAAISDLKTSINTLKGAANPAVEQMRAQSRFRMMGFSDEEQARAFTAVDKTAGEVRGVRKVDVQETLTSLVNTVGSVDEAITLLPLAARRIATVEALGGSRETAIRQFGASAKALELLGKDQDLGEMQKYMNIIAQADMATGGEINADQFRAFAKYANIAAPGMTPEGLRKYLPMLGQMGGSRAGTALMTLYSNMVGGRIPSQKLRYWEELGLLDKSKVDFNKQTGKVQRLRPGAIPIAEDLGRDPVSVADKLTEVLKGHGVDVKSYDAVNKQLMSMFGDRTGAGALAQMINYRAALDKEARNYERALGINEGHAALFGAQNPLGQYLDAQAKWNDTQARSGLPLVNAGGQAAGAAAGFMAQHPEVASAISGVVTLGQASTEAASGVGSLASVIKGLAGGGAAGTGGGSGIAGTGVDKTDVMATGFGVVQTAKWLGMGLARIAPPLAILSTAGFLGSGIYQNYEADKQQEEKKRQAGGTQFEEVKKLREQHGGRLPADVSEKLARETFAGVHRGGLLSSLDLKTYGTPGYPGVMAAPQYDREAVMAGEFRRQAPQLQFPELMRGFITDIRRQMSGGVIPKEGGEHILKVAERAQPEAFKEATKSIANPEAYTAATEQMNQLTAAATPLAPAIAAMFDPTKNLTSGLTSAQTAATGFASRVNSLDLSINLPSVTFGGVSHTPALSTSGTSAGGGVPTGGRTGKQSFFSIPSKAAGGIVERGGLVNIHDREAIVPARVTDRWRDGEFGDEFGGAPDFSAFAQLAAGGGKSGGVHFGDINITMPAGSNAADPEAVATAVVEAIERRLAALEADTYDPRFHYLMTTTAVGGQVSRS